MQEQRQRPALQRGQFAGEPVDLFGLGIQPGVEDQCVEADETPSGGVDAPAVVAENRAERLAVRLRSQLWRRRANLGRVVAEVVIAGQIAALHGKRVVLRLGECEIVGKFKSVKPEIAGVDHEVGARGVDMLADAMEILAERRITAAEMVTVIWVRRNKVMRCPCLPT